MSATFHALIRAAGTPGAWGPLLVARPRARRPALAVGQHVSRV
ncbi:hypothetical protein O7632_26140 [Solwaraspora sp. WMMD406]|nr:hypothetical protein [Solwaraspora sp. WMMD406]MDG4767544.1 hypothetical protein [Solwaraspora sp. WMMD406]